MRFKHTLAVGVALALPILYMARLEANDGILSRLHHHGDCDAKQSVVRLPAQEIRIETTQPRVIVNQGQQGFSHPRMRGFFPAQPAAFMPMAQGPFVATFLPVQGSLTLGGGSVHSSAASNALRALQDMETQGHEVATQLAAHKASTDYLNTLQKSIQARMSSTFSTSAGTTTDLQQIMDRLNTLDKRTSDIEKLLLIHDKMFKEKGQ